MLGETSIYIYVDEDTTLKSLVSKEATAKKKSILPLFPEFQRLWLVHGSLPCREMFQWHYIYISIHNCYGSTGFTAPSSFFLRLSYTLNLMAFYQTWRPCSRDSKVSHVLRSHHKHQTWFIQITPPFVNFEESFLRSRLTWSGLRGEMQGSIQRRCHLHPLEISALLRI